MSFKVILLASVRTTLAPGEPLGGAVVLRAKRAGATILSARKESRTKFNRKLKLGAACVAVVALAGCGSSGSTSLTNAGASTRTCWVAATHKLAVTQVKKFLGPLDDPHSRLYDRHGTRRVLALNQSTDMAVAERWAEGKPVKLPPLSRHYYGPTRAWLQATKARCGGLRA